MTALATSPFIPNHGPLLAYLDRRSIPFWLSRSSVPAGVLATRVVPVLADGKAWLVLVPTEAEVDLAKVAKAARAKQARLAGAEELFGQLEQPTAPGGFARLHGLPLVCDAAVAEAARLRVPSGVPGLTVDLECDDFLALEKPITAAVCASAASLRRS